MTIWPGIGVKTLLRTKEVDPIREKTLREREKSIEGYSHLSPIPMDKCSDPHRADCNNNSVGEHSWRSESENRVVVGLKFSFFYSYILGRIVDY